MPRPKRDMKRLNVYLTKNQWQEIHKMSQKTNLTFAELVRRGLDFFLESERKKK